MSRRPANRMYPSVMGGPRSVMAQPVWQPRQCSITGDDGLRWRGPVNGKTRPITPTEAASRRAWGREERPFTSAPPRLLPPRRAAPTRPRVRRYLFENDSSAAFSRMRRCKTPPARRPSVPTVPPLATTKRPQTATTLRTLRTLETTMAQRAEERVRSAAASGFRNLDFPADATKRPFGSCQLTAPLSPCAFTRLKTLVDVKNAD